MKGREKKTYHYGREEMEELLPTRGDAESMEEEGLDEEFGEEWMERPERGEKRKDV